MPVTTPTKSIFAPTPWRLPLWRRFALAGAATTCMTFNGYAAITGAPLSSWMLLANLGAVLLLAGLAWAGTQAAGAIALRPDELAGRMARAREGERERLGRDLHDDIGQLLTAARLQVDWLSRRMPASLAPSVNALCNTLSESLDKVRDMSALLCPRQLSSLGLEASLRGHLCKVLAGNGLNWSLDCRQRLDGLPAEMSIAAFRIVQEAVTNLLRHANASNLWIEITRERHGLAICLRDDGEGFDTQGVPAGRGLAGMAERAQALRGHLKVFSTPGGGTRIEALLPWPGRAARRAAKASL